MAQLEALREGFSEMNRLLTDRQVFNEQAKSREAQDVRNNSILASQLEDRAFGRAMDEKKMIMGMEMNDFERNMANQKFDLAAEKFDHTKSVALQVQEREAKLAEVEMNYKRALIDKQNLEMQDDMEYNEPKPLWGQIEGSGIRDAAPADQDRMAADIYGGLVERDIDGNITDIVDENGDTLTKSAREVRFAQTQLDGDLAPVVNNTPQKAMAEVAKINDRLEVLTNTVGRKTAAAKQSDIRFKPQAAKARAEMNKLKAQRLEQEVLVEDGAEIDLEEQIDKVQAQVEQLIQIRDPKAEVKQTELASLRDQLKAEKFAKAKGLGANKASAIMKVAVELNDAGNVIRTELVPVNKNAPGSVQPWSGGRDNLKGMVWGEEYGFKTEEDHYRKKTFTQTAESVYGDKKGDGWFIRPENQELYSGLINTMYAMRDLDEYKDLSDSELAVKAQSEHADTIKDYFGQTELLSQGINPMKPDETLTEEQVAVLQEALDLDVMDTLGSLPTEGMFKRLIERGQVHRTAGRPPKKNDKSWWDKLQNR